MWRRACIGSDALHKAASSAVSAVAGDGASCLVKVGLRQVSVLSQFLFSVMTPDARI